MTLEWCIFFLQVMLCFYWESVNSPSDYTHREYAFDQPQSKNWPILSLWSKCAMFSPTFLWLLKIPCFIICFFLIRSLERCQTTWRPSQAEKSEININISCTIFIIRKWLCQEEQDDLATPLAVFKVWMRHGRHADRGHGASKVWWCL